MRRRTTLTLALTFALAAPALADTTRGFDSGTANRLFYQSQTAAGRPVRVIQAKPLIGKASSTKTTAETATRRASKSVHAPRHQGSRVIRSTHTVHSRHIAYGNHGNTVKVSPKVVHHGNARVIDHRSNHGNSHNTAHRTVALHTPRTVYSSSHRSGHSGHSSHASHSGHHKSLKTVWGHGYYPTGVYNHRTVFATPHYSHSYHRYPTYYSSYRRPYYSGCYRPSYGYGYGHYGYGHHGSRVSVGYRGSNFNIGFGIRF